jgi:hypothetical protein
MGVNGWKLDGRSISLVGGRMIDGTGRSLYLRKRTFERRLPCTGWCASSLGSSTDKQLMDDGHRAGSGVQYHGTRQTSAEGPQLFQKSSTPAPVSPLADSHNADGQSPRLDLL